jgi:hypothetical protein
VPPCTEETQYQCVEMRPTSQPADAAEHHLRTASIEGGAKVGETFDCAWSSAWPSTAIAMTESTALCAARRLAVGREKGLPTSGDDIAERTALTQPASLSTTAALWCELLAPTGLSLRLQMLSRAPSICTGGWSRAPVSGWSEHRQGYMICRSPSQRETAVPGVF